MPEMSGDEFLAKARSFSNAEAILLTGYADLKAVIGAVNNGRITAYVPKPWDPSMLTSMVASACERHRLSRELDRERALLATAEPIGTVTKLAEVAGRHWKAELDPPARAGAPHTLTVVLRD